MKKVLLLAAFAVFGMSNMNAQEEGGNATSEGT